MNDEFLSDMFIKAQEMLALAETLYGARDTSWNFTGVILQDDGPHIWFPNDCDTQNEIQIALSPSAVNKYDLALYQLSHEVVHLLAPNREPPTILLEEGVAVYFSVHHQEFKGDIFKQDLIDRLTSGGAPENYKYAYKIFKELNEINPDAIVLLRSKEPAFCKMTPDFIVATLGINRELAECLCERRTMR